MDSLETPRPIVDEWGEEPDRDPESRARKIAALLALPWTVRTGRYYEENYFAWVVELPDLIATAPQDGHVLMEQLRASLRGNLNIRLYYGDPIPRPIPCPPGSTAAPAPARDTSLDRDN